MMPQIQQQQQQQIATTTIKQLIYISCGKKTSSPAHKPVDQGAPAAAR